jgi:glycosyltransferase involved in cell wall biosynthesis
VLQRKLINHVIFEGSVDQKNILNFYNQADILVLSSFAEGLPNLLMEAMAMEIPCVTTHIAGIPELIRHGEEGMLVAPSDADMIARSIALLMDMPELRRQLGQAGRKRILRDYELQRNTERLANIFQQRLTVVTKP